MKGRTVATGLIEFHEYVRQIVKVASWVLPTAAITPIVVSFVDLNPPWPNRIGLTAVTCAAVLFTVIAVFQLLDSRRRRTVNLTVSAALVIGAVLAVVYFVLFAFLVFKPEGSTAFVKGLQCTSDALLLHSAACPWLDDPELRSVAFNEWRLWTAPSIYVARIVLMLVWIAMFIAFATCLGAFVRHQAQLQR